MNTQQKAETTELVEDLLWRFGEAEFDERAGQLKLAGVDIELEPRPLEVLAYLLRHAGEVVTKDELLEAVWQRKPELISDKVLTNAIGKLRRELRDEQEAIITTLPRRGYRLSVPVSRVVVGRRAVPKLDFKPGEKVPRREQWRLIAALDPSQRSEVWLAEHEKTHARRVFKFSGDGARLSALKREVTLSRVLVESLGERTDFIPVLEWNFEEAPYFIECDYGGENWLQWAEAQGGLSTMPLATRLDLFVQAAEAIGAAHGVGVLHKDIKPANLLVSPKPNGGWQVRVTDFGSGRLMEPGRLEELGITRLGFTQTQAVSSDSLTGTPLYLAPELLTGQSPTQASDVYALGVLLYQLLVADFKKPLSAGWEREVDEELLREDIALAASGDAGLRLDSARALAQRVAQLPQRRLERAAALQRQGAVEAAHQALARVKQRRPWLVATTVAIIVGVAIGAHFFRNAVKARDQAQAELTKSQAILDFMRRDLLGRSISGKGGSSNITLLDALKQSTGKIETRFHGLPLIAASVYEALAVGLAAAGAPQDALNAFDKADALYLQVGRTLDPDAIKIALDAAEMSSRLQKFDDSLLRLQAVKTRIESVQKDQQLFLALWEATKGRHHIQRNEQAEAFEALQKSVQLFDRYEHSGLVVPTDLRQKVRNARSGYAGLLSDKGQVAEALPILQRAVEDCAAEYSLANPTCNTLRYRLATAYLQPQVRNLALSEKMSMDLRRDVIADGDPKAFILINIAETLADIYMTQQRLDQSLEQRKFAHALYVELRGFEKLNSAITAASVADAALAKGDVVLAQEWIEKAFVIGKATLADNAARQVLLVTHAEVLTERGAKQQAANVVKEIDLSILQSTAQNYPWKTRLDIIRSCLLPESSPNRAALLSAANKALQPRASDYPTQMRLIKKCSASDA